MASRIYLYSNFLSSYLSDFLLTPLSDIIYIPISGLLQRVNFFLLRDFRVISCSLLQLALHRAIILLFGFVPLICSIFLWLILLFSDALVLHLLSSVVLYLTSSVLPPLTSISHLFSRAEPRAIKISGALPFGISDPDYHRRRRALRRQRRRYERAVALVGDSSIDPSLHTKLQSAGASQHELFLVHDSGATRCLLCATSSPLLPYLKNRRPAPPGFVTVGGGRRLPYCELGEIGGVTFTTVNDLRYDLYSAVSAAKRGVKTVIEYDQYGKNRSHLCDRKSGNVTPLVERNGMLAIPMTQFLWQENDSTCATGLASCGNDSFALAHDILPSLNETDADFLIHRRLAHASERQLRALARVGAKGVHLFGALPKWCHSCYTAKHKREPTSKKSNRHPNARPGQYLHSDLSSVSVQAIGGYKYVLTAVDEASGYYLVKLLRSKVDTLPAMRELAAEFKALTKRDVVQWTFDRGSEFIDRKVKSFVHNELLASTFYANVESPWENGLAERSFGVLFDMTRAMLHDSKCPTHMWGLAIQHAAYVHNRLPARKLGDKSPHHVLSGRPADVSKLRVFGCPAMVYVRERERRNKISHRSVHAIFVGMSTAGNGWIFLTGAGKTFKSVKFIDSKDVKFNEMFMDMRGPCNTIFKDGQSFDQPLSESGSDYGTNFEAHEDDDIFVELTSNVPIRISPSTSASHSESSSSPAPASDPTPSRSRSRRSSPANWPGPTRSSRVKNPPHKFNPDLSNYASQLTRGSAGLVTSSGSTGNDDYTLDECFSLFSVDYQSVCCLAASGASAGADPVAATFQGDPVSWKSILAMAPADSLRYKKATLKELEGLKRKCIKLIPKSSIPHGHRVYHASVNWVTKFVNGEYLKTKCRACFAGSSYDKSNSDCFAPTAKFASVLIVLCLAAMMRLFCTGLDYEMAYLNAPLDELCFMRAPTCMRETNDQGEELYWQCETCIYGHPRSGALWAKHMAKAFRDYGFYQLRTDQCLFVIWRDSTTFAIVVTHTDDCIVASNDRAYGDFIRSELLKLFPGTDLGKLDAFCGVKIIHTDFGLQLSLRHYLDNFFALFNVKPLVGALSPLPSRPLTTDCPANPVDWIKSRYLKITGMLIWVYTHCRLDLAWPIHAVTRVMHNPSEHHLGILMHLCRYVCSTADWNLCYRRDDNLVNMVPGTMDFTFYTFCDSSYADDPVSMCSTGGYYVKLAPEQGVVCGKSFLARSPALSSTEAEYVCCAEAAKQSAWVKQLLEELGIFKSVKFELLEDSEPCLNALRRSVSDSRFKHVRIYFHFLRDLIRERWCSVVKIGTADQTADLCTKLLPPSTVKKHSHSVLGLDASSKPPMRFSYIT